MTLKTSLRETFFRIWYWYVNKVDRNARILFMNFGYHDKNRHIVMEAQNECDRYSIQLYHHLVDAVNMQGKDIVEIGCGRGGGLSYIASNFSPATAIGIDLNNRAVRFCNRHYKMDGLSFLQGDAQSLQLENDSCDIVINVESSHRYPNMVAFLNEVFRILRPGGYFLFTDFRYDCEMYEIRKDLEESGFTLIKENNINQEVTAALTLDDTRRRKLIKDLAPRFLHNLALNFAGAMGSETYNNFASGKYIYFSYIFKKQLKHFHMKTIQKLFSAFFVILIANVLISCVKHDSINPFMQCGMERELIVVISDIHLGADLAYAECKDNLPALEEFLTQIRMSPNVKELVIAGDLLDEWFVPAPINTYQGKDQEDFVKRIATANKGVFDVLNRIIRERKILVTYVPGNHDLTITQANVNKILPGINQKRDTELGLGTYSPVGYPKIVIEHGHRYNFFCAPDPFSNQDIAPGTILPPGYFFTRIAALYVSQGHPTVEVVIPAVTPNTTGDESQNLLFAYWKLWEWTLNMFTIENNFNEDIIVTNMDGFTGAYSVNDLLPYQETPGGLIDVTLYKGIQDNWAQRQEQNHVAVPIPAMQAISGAALASETDNQSATQYFLNPKSNVRIVVFGHSHVPTMISSFDHLQQKSIYVNSGTWIDDNPKRTTMNFVVITPQKDDCCSQTHVKLYNFENEVITLMAEDSVRL